MTKAPPPKLLAVDDRKENLLVVTSLLEDLDVEILTARSGNEALALMLDHDFAVVLMDVQMPEMDGFETVALMKRNNRTRHIPVIYLTALSTDRHFVVKGYETGAVDYVFKPVEPAILRGKVQVFLELDALKSELSRRNDELEQLSADLEQAAMTDPLTGLRNRRFLSLRIADDLALVGRAFRDARRGVAPDSRNRDLAFLMVDIDHFKTVNDVHGHDAGDRVLVEIARILGEQVRASDIVVRWGGEEFLVLLRQTNRTRAARVAERIRSAVKREELSRQDGATLRVTCSIGACVYPLGSPECLDWEQVVNVADWALLSAKRAGRNRVLCAELVDPETTDAEIRRIVADPQAAYEADRLTLQPAETS